ncbi:hypothetical protein AEM42_04200 [Betaproteobacteria bacterium UKL13-2]|jgi:hypothetical protein|nr:hypothetical protein AEM42_04200 [Betaproteobacteria bacterium UKL13-2]
MRAAEKVFAIGIFPLLIGCANATDQVALPTHEAPLDWNDILQARYAGTDCPLISGVYRSSGTERIFSQIDGKPQAPRDGSAGPWKIGYSKRSGAQQVLDMTDHRVPKGLELGEVQIVQLSGTRYEVYRPQKAGKVEVDVFDSIMGDFNCIGGTIHFPTNRNSGSSDGTTHYIESTRSMRVSKDGALLIKSNLGSKSSSLIFFRSEGVFEIYARFVRLRHPDQSKESKGPPTN